jgi:hypothetical protein
VEGKLVMPANLSEIRATLERLQEYHEPEAIKLISCETQDDLNFEERYTKARDKYLDNRLIQLTFEHLRNFDGNSVPLPDIPSEEEQVVLQENRDHAKLRLQRATEEVQDMHQSLRIRYDTFVRRRDEISRMVADMEESIFLEEDAEKENDVMDVDDESLLEMEQKCIEMTKRKYELMNIINQKETEVKTVKKRHDECLKRIEHFHLENPDMEIVAQDNFTHFEAETDKIQAEANKYKEILKWYDGMQSIFEDFLGIQILSVDQAEESKDISLKLKLVHGYDVEISLSEDTKCGSKLRVQSAKFLSPAFVQIISKNGSNPLRIDIPDLDDLVSLARSLGPVEDLRFVLRESVARISAIVARVSDLSILREKYVTNIGMLSPSMNTFGGDDQEVVCSLNEGLTVMLVLSPDCPISLGSVYIDQIVGIGGWNAKVLDDLKERLNHEKHQSPVDIMKSLTQELNRLQSNGAITLPLTPVMPRRNY